MYLITQGVRVLGIRLWALILGYFVWICDWNKRWSKHSVECWRSSDCRGNTERRKRRQSRINMPDTVLWFISRVNISSSGTLMCETIPLCQQLIVARVWLQNILHGPCRNNNGFLSKVFSLKCYRVYHSIHQADFWYLFRSVFFFFITLRYSKTCTSLAKSVN